MPLCWAWLCSVPLFWVLLCLGADTISVIVLNVIMLSRYAECHHAQCSYAEVPLCWARLCSVPLFWVMFMLSCRYNKCHCLQCVYAQSRYAECHHAQCSYAEVPLCWVWLHSVSIFWWAISLNVVWLKCHFTECRGALLTSPTCETMWLIWWCLAKENYRTIVPSRDKCCKNFFVCNLQLRVIKLQWVWSESPIARHLMVLHFGVFSFFHPK